MNVPELFKFETKEVRVIQDEVGEPLFVGADICEILGFTNPSKAMTDHCRGITKRYPLSTSGGVQEVRVLAEPDVLRLIIKSRLPAAIAFEKVVFEEILPSIRKTGAYKMPPSIRGEAFNLVPSVMRAAKAFGLDQNAASISTNQAILKLTGTNVLQLLGHTSFSSETQVLYFTPTELGAQIEVSAQELNKKLCSKGLQEKLGDKWVPTDAAEGLYRLLDTGKRKGSGTPVLQVKWDNSVLEGL